MLMELKILPDIPKEDIEKELKRFAKNYVLNYNVDERLRKLEDYLFDNYKFDIDIKEIVAKIVDNFKIDNIGNKIFLMLSKTSKIENVNLELIEKIITFGNRSIKGHTIIRDSVQYALYNM